MKPEYLGIRCINSCGNEYRHVYSITDIQRNNAELDGRIEAFIELAEQGGSKVEKVCIVLLGEYHSVIDEMRYI